MAVAALWRDDRRKVLGDRKHWNRPRLYVVTTVGSSVLGLVTALNTSTHIDAGRCAEVVVMFVVLVVGTYGAIAVVSSVG